MSTEDDDNDNVLSDSLGWRAVALASSRHKLSNEYQCKLSKLMLSGTLGLLLECPKCRANNVIRADDIGKTSDCWKCKKMLVMGITW